MTETTRVYPFAAVGLQLAVALIVFTSQDVFLFILHFILEKKKYITNHTHIHDNFYCKSRFAIVDSMKVQLSHETSNSIFIYASCSMFMYKPQTTSFTWMRLALSLGLRLESS